MKHFKNYTMSLALFIDLCTYLFLCSNKSVSISIDFEDPYFVNISIKQNDVTTQVP